MSDAIKAKITKLEDRGYQALIDMTATPRCSA